MENVLEKNLKETLQMIQNNKTTCEAEKKYRSNMAILEMYKDITPYKRDLPKTGGQNVCRTR